MGALLSILVPVYNVSPYLADFLASFQGEVDAGVELVFWDDASSDHSVEIIQTWQAAQTRYDVKLFRNASNQGVTQTRQHLLSKAQGEYIWYVDPDDLLANDAVDVVIRTLNRHRPDVFLFGYQVFDDATGRTKAQEQLLFKSADVKVNDPAHELYQVAIQDNKHYFWNKVFKRAIVAHIEIQAMPVYEDIYYVPTWLFHCQNYVYLDQPLVKYRLREGSLSHRNDFTQVYAIYAYLDQAAFCLKQIGEGKTYAYLLYKAYMHYYRLQKALNKRDGAITESDAVPLSAALLDICQHHFPVSGWGLVGQLGKSGMFGKMLKLALILTKQSHYG